MRVGRKRYPPTITPIDPTGWDCDVPMRDLDEPAREIRVVSSQIDLGDISGRVLFPTRTQGPWLPFLRFAETTTRGGGDDQVGHTHREEEVVNYLVTGQAESEDPAGSRSTLEAGAVELLTANSETHHKFKGLSPAVETQWISVVVRCLKSAAVFPYRSQIAVGPRPPLEVGVTVERPVVGSRASVVSDVGLECTDVEFLRAGRCTCPVGPGRRTVAYFLSGSGTIGDQELKTGTAALIDGVENLSIRSESAARIIVASVPRRPL